MKCPCGKIIKNQLTPWQKYCNKKCQQKFWNKEHPRQGIKYSRKKDFDNQEVI